jgi:hypothetical protein
MADVVTIVKADLSYIRHHIFLLTTVVILVFGSVYGVESLIASHDAANNAQWRAILQAQIVQTQAIADKLTSDEKTWAQQNAAQQAVIAQLTNSIIQRDKTTAVQVQHDTTLSAVEAAQRLSQQTKSQPGEVLAQGDNILLNLPISRQIVASLDQLPTLQLDLVDIQKQLISETTIATNLQNNVDGQQNLIASMKVQATDADRSCKADIATLKAQARKSKLKWFGLGVVVGLVSARFLGI